ncbi:DNA repair protein Rad50p [[Candida] jaroonii]|uniref:DNA repair protein Rad50p n=1 Tax=[Candida] jaroonii TaxID=467808 RepID=A0ACA9YB75_9ASCO|nr:DNA repair protein Rad50p [[Candida] jaroonii]
MSFISHLSITGIRSFGSDHPETIEFKSPLTLIWGVNGSGKTTIIECLKYATTGILPPNSKGGAFINDPVLQGKPSTNAQVKIGFKSVAGEAMVGTRTMKLDVKNGKHTFKTIEAQLGKIKDGKKTNVSGKGFDYDTEVASSLGVSKAILDNVIFCHQDESYWPLSEASVLKKKFDEIFQASQFTKVLETLKNINKEVISDSKLIQKSVEYLSNDKKRADLLRKESLELSDNVKDLENQRKKIKYERVEAEESLNEIFKTNQEFQAILSKFDQLSYTKQTLSQQCERLESSIEIYPDSLEELMTKLNNFSDTLDEYNEEIAKLNNSNKSLTNEITNKRSHLNELSKLEGSLNAKKQEYENNLSKFEEVTGQDLMTIDKSSFKSELENTVTTTEINLNYHRKESARQKSERMKIVDSLTELLSNQNNLKQIRLDMKIELTQKIKQLKEKINKSDSNEETLEFEQNELKSLQKKYNESNISDFVGKLDKDVKQNSEKLTNLEDEVDQLNKTIQEYNNQKEVMVRINYLREATEQKEASVSSNLSKVSKIIPVNRDNFQNTFHEEFNLVNTEYQKHKKIHDSNVNEKNSLEAQLTNQKSLKKDLENSFNVLETKILKVVPKSEIEEYDITIEDLEFNYHDALDSYNTYEASKQFKIKAIEIGKKSHNCFMCQRTFDQPSLSKFVTALEADISKSTDEYKKSLDASKKELDSYKSVSGDIVRYKTLGIELKQVDLKIEDIKSRFQKVNESVIESDLNFQESRDRLDEFESSKYLITEIQKDLNQISTNSQRIESLTKEIGGNPITESIDELNKLQNDKSSELKNLRNQISKDKELKYSKERELSKLEGAIKDKEIKIKNIESGLSDIKQYQTMIDEYQKQVAEVNDQISEITNKLTKVSEDKESEEQINKDLFKKLDTDEENLTKSYNDAKQRSQEITALIESIQYFENHDKSRIDGNVKDIEQANMDIQSLESLLDSNNEELKSFERKVNESSNFKSLIRDNIDYKNYTQDLAKVEQEIKDLNVGEAEEMKEKYLEQTEELNSVIANLNADDAGKLGEIRQIDERIKSLNSKLETDYKDVETNYHENWIDLQTHLLISNDIVTYSKSIDNAIMKYHSLKMTEINKILKDSWMRTYKNSDIDYIAIRSDPINQTKGKSYNYRVVMQKGLQEIDMRGRCSAGQRVLTSILIRLALAECFGSNCGIIALDEPTTNLDTANARSLAISLNQLIESRKSQKNFQLIIITHDMEFLSHMRGGNYINNFYQISKDDSLFSKIKSYPIEALDDFSHD